MWAPEGASTKSENNYGLVPNGHGHEENGKALLGANHTFTFMRFTPLLKPPMTRLDVILPTELLLIAEAKPIVERALALTGSVGR